MSKCGTSQYGLVGLVIFSQRLDLMISEAFSDLNTSRVYPRRCSFQADARAVSSGEWAVGLGVSLEAGGGFGFSWGGGSGRAGSPVSGAEIIILEATEAGAVAADGEGQQVVLVAQPAGDVAGLAEQGAGVQQQPQEAVAQTELLPAALLLPLAEFTLQLAQRAVRAGVGVADLGGLAAQVGTVALLPVQVVGDAPADALQHPARVLHLPPQHRQLLPQAEPAARRRAAPPLLAHPEQQLAPLGVVVLLIVPIRDEVVVQAPVGHLGVQRPLEVPVAEAAEPEQPHQAQRDRHAAADEQPRAARAAWVSPVPPLRAARAEYLSTARELAAVCGRLRRAALKSRQARSGGSGPRAALRRARQGRAGPPPRAPATGPPRAPPPASPRGGVRRGEGGIHVHLSPLNKEKPLNLKVLSSAALPLRNDYFASSLLCTAAQTQGLGQMGFSELLKATQLACR